MTKSGNTNREHSLTPSARRGGVTLIELLIVIAVMAILAAAVIPTLEPNVYSQLVGAAQVVQAELGYARNMAVTNDSRYSIAFDSRNNRIILTHSGTNTALNTLPRNGCMRTGRLRM